MAFMMACEKVSLEFPTKDVFDGITVGVEDGDRIGIVGKNGDGKSTLLKLLAKEQEPDDGRVLARGGLRIGVLGQGDHLNDEDTVCQAVVGDIPEYEWAADPRIRSILVGLLSDVPWDAKVGNLSGGQRRRTDLARLLIGDWDVLLLDEPTNHLDMRSITWLADHLKSRWSANEGALLVVTHDRWFLDEVCLDMWEVHDRTITPFEGGYSAYIQQRVERDRVQAVTEQRRRNAVRKELAWLSRGARARSTKPKFHVKAAQELVAEDPPVRDSLELKRLAMQRLGKQVIDLTDVSVSYEGHEVLKHVDWLIGPGDRIGILGSNGAGKTTLLNILSSQLQPTSGRVKVGKTVKLAMLSQQLKELAPVEDDYVRVVLSRCKTRYVVDGEELSPTKMLERLGFSKDQFNALVRDLSGGQRRRLQLLLVLMEEPNVLILDEPGNDMDTDMLAVMEDLLDAWPGTLFVVSHDRYLVERVTDNQYALINGHLRHVPGGVDEFLQLEASQEVLSGPPNSVFAQMMGQNDSAEQDDADADAQEEAKPKYSGGELFKMRKELASLERKVATLEEKVADAQNAMFEVDPSDYMALGKAQEAVDELVAQKEELEERWMLLAEEIGE